MKLIRRSTWLNLAIDLKSSVIHAIWRRVVASMIFAFIIVVAYHKGFPVNQPTLAGLIPGVVLGLLLVFRTNTAYERFWEGCKIWYNLLSASQILCRNIWVMVPVNNSKDLRSKISNIRLVGLLKLEQGFLQLIALMNVFVKRLYLPPRAGDFYFSFA